MSNFKIKKIQRYKPHMTIRLRKEIMKRSCFENKPSDRSNETILSITKEKNVFIKDIINPYNCLSKNNNFSIKTTND